MSTPTLATTGKHGTNATTTRDFPLAPLPRSAWGLLLLLWLVLMAAAWLQPQQQPAGNPVPWWLVVPFATALVLVGPFVVLQRRHIRLEGRTLVVAAALHTRRVAVDALAPERARILSLEEHVAYKPMLQLFGFGLPGFKAGHYLLRNRQRAFCLLTDRQRVLLLPQRDGRLLLLSPEKPQTLLDALRECAAGADGGPRPATHAPAGRRHHRKGDHACRTSPA